MQRHTQSGRGLTPIIVDSQAGSNKTSECASVVCKPSSSQVKLRFSKSSKLLNITLYLNMIKSLQRNK